MKDIPKSDLVLYGLLVVALVAAGYFGYQTISLQNELTEKQAVTASKEAEQTQALAAANEQINELQDVLDNVEEELEELEDDYRDEKDRNEEFEDQIRAISKTVGTLDKLSKTDEELLQKYSKVYFLNENYVPSDLDQIDDEYLYPTLDISFFHGDALPFLEEMIEDAEDDDIELKIVSAYRSFDYQEELKEQFTTIYGSGANAFSADQGFSEHQLGTAVDLTDAATGGTFQSFAETDSYRWLLRNAHKYGFTLSYPEGNEFYIFEPWHWRFVGVDLATDLHDDEAGFYDWDQRRIDEYLISIFDD